VSLLDIHVLGSPVLRKETVPVTQFDASLQSLIDDMFETMYAAEGIGLAAPQVGRLERVAVLDVERPARVVVDALDREGKPFSIEASELLARCLQHEIDHLHGKLFIDYLSVLKRRAAMAKWEGMRRDYPGLLRNVATETKGEHHHDGEL
jgi:peptide deformylase